VSESADSPTFEEALLTLQGLLGRRVMVYIGGASGNPGIAAYAAGVLASAADDEGFDELVKQSPAAGVGGEALHFRVDDEEGSPRLVFVVWQRFFFQALWLADNLLAITQRDLSDEGNLGVAITLRIDD